MLCLCQVSDMCFLQADQYRFSRCKAALPMTKMRKIGLPLPASHLETLGSKLAWEDIQVASKPCTCKSQEDTMLLLRLSLGVTHHLLKLWDFAQVLPQQCLGQRSVCSNRWLRQLVSLHSDVLLYSVWCDAADLCSVPCSSAKLGCP